MKTYQDIDQYISTFPQNVQALLQQIRHTIKHAAPNAEEAIKYGIPTFVLHGNLVHFGGYKNHIGFYPAPMGIAAFKEETTQYEAGKGTLQFKLDKPLPLDLIKRIVEFRVETNLQKQKRK
ncbi:iron chaperone [Mucilaginibacter auburnensis]|uniref:Uncharacterized protein YdhG (YjbR/CyaY superfamily) n=1 Tax=Mucilaginibacter auburnensis TaxID=1457233 RepID=A0A2H9VSZ7_9SPHI|nr:DUF1801 domain-containing protein [Mucilaginibacter auburnensis]PJJ83940.1 uncharacterized protein YdhG (YjbR/CyaY superfamily) [Mucilaginibacter auburnensis]